MSLNSNYLSNNPHSFPHYDNLNSDLLGPFWADADSSGITSDCCNIGVVYYHMFQFNVNQVLSELEQRVFDLATLDGQRYIDSTFVARWVLLVTWSQMIPYPYADNQYSFEVNTFLQFYFIMLHVSGLCLNRISIWIIANIEQM